MFSRPSPYATPLPYAQVAVLMGVRLAEPSESREARSTELRRASCLLLASAPRPLGAFGAYAPANTHRTVAYTIIFPFINQMIDELGVTDNPDRIGFYSGLVVGRPGVPLAWAGG